MAKQHNGEIQMIQLPAFMFALVWLAAVLDFSDVTGLIGALTVALIPISLVLLGLRLIDRLTGGHIGKILRGEPFL